MKMETTFDGPLELIDRENAPSCQMLVRLRAQLGLSREFIARHVVAQERTNGVRVLDREYRRTARPEAKARYRKEARKKRMVAVVASARVRAILAGTDLPELRQVLAHVCIRFGVTPEQVLARTRFEEWLWPRQVAMYLAVARLGLTLERVGEFFARDHGSVRNAATQVLARRDTDAKFRATLMELEAQFPPVKIQP